MANNRLNEDYLDKDHSDEEEDEFEEEMLGEHMVEEQFEEDWMEEKKPSVPFDNFFIGLFGAVLLSIITIRLVTYSELPDVGMKDLLKQVYNSENFQTIMMSAMIPNLILFFILYKLERWKTNYGVVVASLLITAFLFLHVV
ncbi:MAG: hypothetical protein IKP27_10595 [Paludibacteraceae bacterium]|nr:hypothetical protein [Paludibacteraceae bacterium]